MLVSLLEILKDYIDKINNKDPVKERIYTLYNTIYSLAKQYKEIEKDVMPSNKLIEISLRIENGSWSLFKDILKLENENIQPDEKINDFLKNYITNHSKQVAELLKKGGEK
jgi:hypothetical protein